MVCAKCQKISKTTTLATPGVKKKNDMYYGSPAGSLNSGDKAKTSATLGQNGIGKASFISVARLCSSTNYIQRASCYRKQQEIHTLHTLAHVLPVKPKLIKVELTATNAHSQQMVRHSEAKIPNRCAAHNLACAMCGTSHSNAAAAAPVITGQKFTLK